MFRTNRMIAAVTLALWASGVAAQGLAQGPAAGGESTPGPTPPPAPPAVQPAAPTGPAPASPAIAPPNAAAPAPAVPTTPPALPNAAQQQQGTPATVLDTQDYESLLGRSVRSAGGDELGRVIDIIIDKDGHPRAAIIDFGGFLGVGTRKIAVDWRALRFAADGNKERKLSVALSRNQVRVSPEYKAGEPIVVLGPASPAVPAPEGDQAAAPVAGPAAPAATPPAPPAAPAPQAPAAPPEKAPDK